MLRVSLYFCTCVDYVLYHIDVFIEISSFKEALTDQSFGVFDSPLPMSDMVCEEDGHFLRFGILLVFGELCPIIRNHGMQSLSFRLKVCDGCFRQSSASFEGSFRIIRKPDSLSLIIMMTFRLFFPTMVSISPNPRTVLSRRRLKVFVLSRHVLVSPLTYRKNHAYYSVSPLWRRCMYRGFPHLSQIGR